MARMYRRKKRIQFLAGWLAGQKTTITVYPPFHWHAALLKQPAEVTSAHHGLCHKRGRRPGAAQATFAGRAGGRRGGQVN
jgi:hypothetical protein